MAAPYDITPAPNQKSLVNAILKLGWSIDPTQTVDTFRGWGYTSLSDDEKVRYQAQHPYAFTRTGSDGGTQTLRLDFPTDYGVFGKTLRRADFEWKRPGTDKVARRATVRHPGSADWRSTDYLWEILAVDGDKTTIRRRVEAFATNPELALWLAAEAKFAAKEASRVEWAEKLRIQELRDRPLPDGWGQLKSAARSVIAADGLTDTAAVVAALKSALADLEVLV